MEPNRRNRTGWRFQPVQNLRDLRKRVRSRKTSEKLDQKAKETREERPRDGAGEAEGGEGRGPCRREAPPGPLGAPAPPLSRPPPPRPSASLLLSPLSSDQVIRRFSLNELFFEDLFFETEPGEPDRGNRTGQWSRTGETGPGGANRTGRTGPTPRATEPNRTEPDA